MPPLEDSLLDYYTRGTYDAYWDRIEHNYTRYWGQHADIPVTLSTGWYDPFPTADTEYFMAMAAKNTAPTRLVVGPWSHVGMRGDATFCLDVDFGKDSAWGVKRYFDEQLEFFNRFLPDDATGQPAAEAPVRIFVMGGGSGHKTAAGKLDHGGRWRDEWEWPLARRIDTAYYLHGDGSLATAAPSASAPPRIGAASPCIVVTLPIEGVGVCANASVCVGCVCVCGGRNSDWGSRLSARCQVVLAALCRLRYVGGKVSTLMVRPTTRRQGLLKQAAGESRATDVPMRCVFLLAAALGTKPGALALPLPHTHRTDTFGLHPS